MIDFLSSLSERAVGQAPVLERRRPSIFEPVAGRVPLDDIHDQAALRETAADVVAERPESVQQIHLVAQPPAAANEVDRSRSSRDRRMNTAREENSPAQPNVVSESRSNRIAENSATLIVEKHVEAVPREELRPSWQDRQSRIEPPAMNSPTRVVETRIEKEVLSVRAKEKDSRFEPKDKRNESSLREQTATVTPVVHHPRTKPGVETRIETRVDKNNDSVIERQDLRSPPLTRLPQFPVPRVPSRRSATPKLHAAPASPAIQVTIGRVEVRATTAAPAKQAKSSAKPTLSLEDYLRARSGESR